MKKVTGFFEFRRICEQVLLFLKKFVTFQRQAGTNWLMLMKTNKNRSIAEGPDDAALVAASLGGDRQAFGKIVTRYQRLLCSLAYSSLGNLE